MKMKLPVLTIIVLMAMISTAPIMAQTAEEPVPLVSDVQETAGAGKLVVLWTSGDREVALKMVFMYTFNAKKYQWWEDITFIVWGPSAKLLSEDQELQNNIKKMVDAGIKVKACKGCSDQYGVSEKLEALGITVLYIGKELTDYIKEDRKILTF
jgi:hypothetical protein